MSTNPNQLPAYPPSYPQSSLVDPPPTTGKDTASMILGILSICLCWLFGVPGLVLGILAIVLASQAKKIIGRYSGMAVAGLVTGICGVVFSAFYTLFFIAIATSGN